MSECSKCGLLEKRSDSFYCYRFEKEIKKEEFKNALDCLYFCQIIYEDEEPLAPGQHLIMQNKDLRSRKMRGPV